MIVARRSFLIGLASALVAPAVVKFEAAERALGGEVVSARVVPTMAWRRVRDILFTCERPDGACPEGGYVGLTVARTGANLPLLTTGINQAGGMWRWNSSPLDPCTDFVFFPDAPMVITCDPPPRHCDARIYMVFKAKDGRSYCEDTTWRGDRLIASTILPLDAAA